MRSTITVSITPGFAAVLGALAGLVAARAPSRFADLVGLVLVGAACFIAGSIVVRAMSALRSTARTERMQREAVSAYLAEQRRHHAECHARNGGQQHHERVN